MNKCFAAATAAALAAIACGYVQASLPALENFSSYQDVPVTISNLVEKGANVGPVGSWITDTTKDESSIESIEGGTGNYLKLQTEGATLTNEFASANSTALNDELADGGQIYIKSTIKFEPSDEVESSLEEGYGVSNGDLKFALYLLQTDDATNIVVYHSFNDEQYDPVFTNDLIAVPSNVDISEPVEVTATLTKSGTEMFFKLELAANNGTVGSTVLTSPTGCTDEELELFEWIPQSSGHWFRCALGTDTADAQIAAVNFQGTGEVRSLEIGTVESTPAVETYEVTWTTENVAVTTNGVAVTSGDEFEAGTVITFTATTGNITNVVVNGAAGTVANPFTYTVTTDATQALTVLAGEESAQPTKPEWAEGTGDGSTSDKYWEWAENHAAGLDLDAEGADYMRQYLLNVDADQEVSLDIESVEVTDEGTCVVIAATAGESVASLEDENINGYLDISVSSDLSTWTRKSIPTANIEFDANGKATVIIPATDGAFVKASVELVEAESALTEVGE